MMEIFNKVYFGNTLLVWVTVTVCILAGLAIVRLTRKTLVRNLKRWTQKTKTGVDDFIAEAFEKTMIPVLFVLVVYFGLRYLTLPATLDNIIQVAGLLVFTFFSIRLVTSTLHFLVLNLFKHREDAELKQKQVRGLLVIIKVIIWILGLVFLLDNLGYNVTTIIAGLGIGGIAIALAAQTILGDLFSYFIILFDRPFEIGDFIIVDDKMGTIEYIGVKTTRLKTLGGEQLICSNKDLTDSRVHNFKRMQTRRVVFKLGVTYQTPAAMLETIPQMVREVVNGFSDLTYDRGHLAGFGDSSINYEFVYMVLTSDYNVYMDRQQAIYLAIFRLFENNGIEFAYPTQTLFVNGLPGERLISGETMHYSKAR